MIKIRITNIKCFSNPLQEQHSTQSLSGRDWKTHKTRQSIQARKNFDLSLWVTLKAIPKAN